MQSRQFNQLLSVFGSPEKIFSADHAALLQAGAGEELVIAITEAARGRGPDETKRRVEASLAWSQDPSNHVLVRHSPDYPYLLNLIPDPPPVLHVTGSIEGLHLPMLAMVGSRCASPDGRRHARRFARELAQGGLGITSGMARGIDAESHQGALQAGGMTVAVLGTGIDRVYPAGHGDLMRAIAAAGGAVVSEFNPGTPPLAANFPRRNRIISGLCLGVLVVEAGLQSGSMITARFALEQGREVFAIPGSINNPLSRGCHRLIAQGAKLVEETADIIEECAALLGSFVTAKTQARPSVPMRHLDKTLGRLKKLIGFDPVTLESLIAQSGMDAGATTAALVELEVLGEIELRPGGYVRQPGN